MIEASLNLQRPYFELQADFALPASGVTAIFGPSGCGKTTLLRAICGLEAGATGHLSVNAQPWLSPQAQVSVEQRGVGLVSQKPCLFEHLTIEENLLYGRKRLRRDSKLIDIQELVTSLGIEKLLHRYPAGLSGGEVQRVALGRALLAEPRLLLMDEPLSALDSRSRETLMSLLERFLQDIDIPVLYVTHSSEEVARLADNLILMTEGRVTKYGAIQEVLGSMDTGLSRSDTAFSVIHGHIAETQLSGLISVDCGANITLRVPSAENAPRPGTTARLRVRARDVSLCLEKPHKSSILNILPAVIDELAESTGGSRLVRLKIGSHQLLSQISGFSAMQLELEKGQSVFVQIKSASLQ